jgi:hypothetical protein
VPPDADFPVPPSPGEKRRGRYQAEEEQRRGARAGTFSRYILVIAFTALATVLLWRMSESREVPVLIVKRDLPAYHLLSMNDVVLGTRSGDEEGQYAVLPIEGRLTLRSVRENEALATSDLSPKVTGFLGRTVAVTGVSIPHAGALAGVLKSGDRIRLVVLRKGRKAVQLSALVISPVTKDGTGRALLAVVLSRKDAEAYASDLLSDSVLLLR